MSNLVLVDTSCLIALTNIGELSLLAKTFDQPIVTTALVASEFGLDLPPFVRIMEMEDLSTFKALRKMLDDGEASLIALARTIPNALLVLDDAKARQTALSYGLSIIGTLGIIVLAKEKSVITRGAPYLQRLKSAGFRISSQLEQTVLNALGETL